VVSAGLLPSGYRLEWTGQYEHMIRAQERLLIVGPVTLIIIFVLLYLNFKSVAESLIVLLSIPFAITGSIWMLWLMGYYTSPAVWVGVIALAGLAAQTGTVMIIYLDEAFHAYQRAGRMKTQHDLFEAITYGAVQRVRPKLMTVCMITFGLVPALWAHGAGAEAIQRIAAPMVGGLITSTILTLEIVPAIYSLWRGRQVEWVKGPRPPRKSWSELSREFVDMERAGHHDSLLTTPSDADIRPASSENEPHKRTSKTWLRILGFAVAIGAIVWAIQATRAKHDRQSPAPKPIAATNAVAHVKVELTDPQSAAIRSFINAAAAVGESLAADNLPEFNRAIGEAGATLERLMQSLPPTHAWLPSLERIARKGDLFRRATLPKLGGNFCRSARAFQISRAWPVIRRIF
jgi:hypothetical protein